MQTRGKDDSDIKIGSYELKQMDKTRPDTQSDVDFFKKIGYKPARGSG